MKFRNQILSRGYKVNLKSQYAFNHQNIGDLSLYLNRRLFQTYDRIALKTTGNNLKGTNIDLGSGDKGFSAYCEQMNIRSYPYDYPEFDIEGQNLPHDKDCVDFITMNAVLEHIHKPDHIFSEAKKVLKPNGLIFIRTPNWAMDFKNFYNDPTHVKPYTPQSLKQTLDLAGLYCLFLEPGLVEKNWIWWRLPDRLKWRIASLIKGGTKSILAVGIKRSEKQAG